MMMGGQGRLGEPLINGKKKGDKKRWNKEIDFIVQ
jgi:hypothetical protein